VRVRTVRLPWCVTLLAALILSGCAGNEPTPTRPATHTPAEAVAIATDIPATSTPAAAHTLAPPTTPTLLAPTITQTSTVTLTPAPTHTPIPSQTHTPLSTATATTEPTATTVSTATVSPSPAPWGCTVLADALNVRNGPGTGYGVLRVVHAGDQMAPLGQSEAGDWIYAISPAGEAGWLSTGYLQCAPSTDGIPIMTPPPLPTSPPAPTIAPTATASMYQYLPAGPARPDPSHPCPG